MPATRLKTSETKLRSLYFDPHVESREAGRKDSAQVVVCPVLDGTWGVMQVLSGRRA